ncbi:carbon-nitrogen family hydrolase [Fictibacillus aquaticus]|uniref:carbon-nitrogen family hydrolase n=1 Tax=Fictibacillus aquaticus TaxID=2021314 RepID=UPI0013FE2756|nr:carbon-nitrogen family hydrolase [Fictibacillus aquaticus]
MKITCVQFDVIYGKPDENRKKASGWISKAADEGADVIVLPELWDTAYDLERLSEIADTEGKNAIEFLKPLAKKHNVNIVGGSIAYEKNGNVSNTMLVFGRDGSVISKYSKAHLIRLMNEEKFITPGSETSQFRIDDVPSAGLICYDIRFPEWVRKVALEGAKIIFVPAQWPIQRDKHWRTLLTARAIENQCYVVACNRSGKDPDNTFAGQSLIIDPWGEIAAESGAHEETLLSAEINPSLVDEVRSRIPIFEDRRKNLY